MEDTPNEVPRILWNRRRNELIRKIHHNHDIIDFGQQYYKSLLTISEVLIRLIQDTENKNFYIGKPWCNWMPKDNIQYNLLDTNKFFIKYNQESTTSCITMEDKINGTKLYISMVKNLNSSPILDGKMYAGSNMIIVQDGELESLIYFDDIGMTESIKDSIEYLKNDSYSVYLIYGNDTETALNLDLYKDGVIELINDFKLKGYIE